MTDLSPAAFAVWDAAWDCPIGDCGSVKESRRRQIAAALRAVAQHCVPDDSEGYWVYIPHVLAIADELENE